MWKSEDIRFTREMEMILLRAKNLEEAAEIWRGSLRSMGVVISPEDEEWIFCESRRLAQKKHSDPLVLDGFQNRIGEDGSRTLTSYGERNIHIWFHTQEVEKGFLERENITVSDNMFSRGNAPLVIIPEEITTLSPGCFSSSPGVRKVVIPKGVTTIPRETFINCTDLTEVILPDTIKVIERGAFFGCKNLQTIKTVESGEGDQPGKQPVESMDIMDIEVEWPKALTKIESEAFLGCESLTGIYLPKRITEIGFGAFAFCPELKKVIVPNNYIIPAMYHVFEGYPLVDKKILISFTKESEFAGGEEDVYRIMNELGGALDLFVHHYIPGPGIIYALTIFNIDRPEENHIGPLVKEEDWEEDFSWFLNDTNWIILNQPFVWKGRLSPEHTRYLTGMLTDTLQYVNAEVYSETDEGLAYYEKEYKCIELINIRFFYVANEWYAMIFEWYD